MATYYIQPASRGWYVMRDGEPTARFAKATQALEMAEMLAAKSAAQGEEAVFSGIVTEPARLGKQAA
ncbi:MAG: hypothetical protein WCD66_09970 [Rhodanobacteraceae bacterium]